MLDLGLIWDTSEIRRKTIDDVVKQLTSISGEVAKWRAPLAGGLLVTTQAGEDAVGEEVRRHLDSLEQERKAAAASLRLTGRDPA